MKILLVSDIHYAVDELRVIMKKENAEFDYIFCMGDIVNMKEDDQKIEEKVKAGERETDDILNIIESKGVPSFYIPGMRVH